MTGVTADWSASVLRLEYDPARGTVVAVVAALEERGYIVDTVPEGVPIDLRFPQSDEPIREGEAVLLSPVERECAETGSEGSSPTD